LAAASFDSTVSLWEYNSSDKKLKYITKLSGQESEVKGVCFSPCGEMLATCSRDKSIWVFDVSAIGSVSSSRHRDESGFNTISMSDIQESGEFTFAPSEPSEEEGEPDKADIECLAVLQGHSQDVKNISFDPRDSQTIVSVSYDDSIKVWRCSNMHDDWALSETMKASRGGHSNTVWDIAFNPEVSCEFITVGADGTMKLWKAKDSTNGRRVASSWILSGPLGAAARYHSMQEIMPELPADDSGGSSWNCACTIQVILPLDEGLPVPPVYSVSWSSDGLYVAVVAGDNTVRVYRRTSVSLLPLSTLKLEHEPNGVAFRPQSRAGNQQKSLSIVCDDGSLNLIDLTGTDDFS
jgi:WD40 repeat protein